MKPLKYHKEDRMAYITVIAYVILVVVIGRCVPDAIWVFKMYTGTEELKNLRPKFM